MRNRFKKSNVTDYHTVSDCAFIDYSGASISTNSVDDPYWKIERNIFMGSNYRASMGVALSGLTDGTTIADNAFLANRVHVKLGRGGNNTYIHNCDFLRFGARRASLGSMSGSRFHQTYQPRGRHGYYAMQVRQ